jgi:acetylornithine/LysW-gamma-L-lysine aminotransferase
VILEVVQGEGGVHPAPVGYLSAARRICDDAGALLIIDEVQTGFGRTGRLFAVEHSGVTPDLLCVAKGIAGGFPMGATLCGARIPAAPTLHGSTFGGNPLACAAALATLETLLDEGLPGRAERLGTAFRASLGALRHPSIREVRGLGLMVGVELAHPAAPVVRDLQDRGVLALPAGKKVVRFLPPLVIGEMDLAATAAALDLALGAMSPTDRP